MSVAPATHVLIMGPQGAGKGTQAALVAPRLDLVHVSTGDLFREVMASGSQLGEEIRGYYDRGALVPDALTVRMLLDRIDQMRREHPALRGALIDGFPRNQAQAEALETALTARGERLVAVISVEAPRQVLIERLSGRLICPNCGATYHREFNPPRVPGVCDVCGSALTQRSDDTPEAVARRLAIYDEQTQPVLAYYERQGLLLSVDGDRPIDEVTTAIVQALATRVD
ncbi:MAG TPA: adenylate kinase [Thermomicrobiaceae bacterium]|nr:adenylate kinase [Thermomicrobiaceae bacterium]